jgi:phosphopantothenoylcysteine decarboxylase/phosphopantothenate--cysteine ligase
MESIGDQLPRLAAEKGDRLMVGFAAETADLEDNARDKLKRKKLDLIVANDVTLEGAGFGTETNIVTLIGRDGEVERHPKLAKDEVADLILDRLVSLRATVKTRPLRAVPSSS